MKIGFKKKSRDVDAPDDQWRTDFEVEFTDGMAALLVAFFLFLSLFLLTELAAFFGGAQ